MPPLPAEQQTTSPPTLSSEPPLSEKLKGLLLANETPLVGPNTARALGAWLAIERPPPKLPSQENIDNLVSRLSLATKERATTPQEAKERLKLYWRALRDIPVEDLARGFDDLLRVATFMPTPAEVRKAAAAYTNRRGFMENRARYLVARHRREWAPPLDDADMARPEDVQALLGRIARQHPGHRDEAN